MSNEGDIEIGKFLSQCDQVYHKVDIVCCLYVYQKHNILFLVDQNFCYKENCYDCNQSNFDELYKVWPLYGS